MGDDPPPNAGADGGVGGDGGGGQATDGTTATSTPLVFNDPHASQAANNIENIVEAELDAFLQSAGTDARPDNSRDDDLFGFVTVTGRKTRSGRKAKDTSQTAPPQAAVVRRSDGCTRPLLSATKTVAEMLAADTMKNPPPPPTQEVAAQGATSTASSAGGLSESSPPAAKAVPPSSTDQSSKKKTTKKKAKKTKAETATEKNPDASHNKTDAPSNDTTVQHGSDSSRQQKDTGAKTENVWSKAQEVLLRKKVEKKASMPKYDDHIVYQKYYDIAQRGDYRVIPDGRPRRPMTEDEVMTLYLWRAKLIHLRTPPKFVEETHTIKERLMFDQIQRDVLTYGLHLDLPGQVRMPVETVKFHFYARLLAKNQSADGPSDRVIDLMTDVMSISVSAASRRAVFNFDRPELRDKWEGVVLRFSFGNVTLRAASYFEQEDKKNGIDKETEKLLYCYYFVGRPDLALTAVHDMAEKLSGGFPILKIEPVEPTGTRTLDPHMWKVTLNSVDAPPDIENVRELTVTQGERAFTIGVHQPRLATRHPCSICLDTTHFRNKCPNKETAKERRERFTSTMTIPTTEPIDHEPVADSLEGYRLQLAQMRAKLEPELAKQEQEAKKPSALPKDTGTSVNTVPVASVQLPTHKKPKKASSSIQLGIIFNAKSTATSASRKLNKNKRNLPLPGKGKRKPATTSVGAKRTFDLSEPTETQKATGVTQQARTSAQTVSNRQPDATRSTQSLVVAHERPPTARAQLTMSRFLPTSAAATPEQADSEVEFVGHKPAEQQPIKIDDLLTIVKMTEVETPANGSCWKYALVIVQSFTCGSAVTVGMKEDVKLARNLGRKINKQLRKKVKGMIADGTLDMVSLCSTVLGKAVQHDSLKLLQEHFKLAGEQKSDEMIARKFWGGEPEFKVFVEDVQQPLYVIDVMENGDSFPQWYHLAEVRSKDGSKVKRAVVKGMTEAAFRAHMHVYRRNKVVPLVILMHHSMAGGRPSGHVTAARISNEEYRAWSGTKRLQSDMTRRLENVLRVLECIDLNLTKHPLPSASPPATPGVGSVYEPSTGDDRVTSAPNCSTAEGTGDDTQSSATEGMNVDADTLSPATEGMEVEADGQAEGTDAPCFELLPPNTSRPSDLPSSIQSILSLDSQPQFDSATLAKMCPVSLATPTSLPFGQREDELIQQMQAEPPFDDATVKQIKRTQGSNNTAFENWKVRQKKEDPQAYKAIHNVKGPIRACEQLQDNIGALISLVHNLPYPEIHVATLPPKVLIRAGQAAASIGHAQMLHRIREQLGKSSQALCSTWIDALVATTTPATTRWHVAQATERWRRLEQAADDACVDLPARSRHGVDDNTWCKMLAYILIVPGCLPWAFEERPVPQRCDALAMWFGMNSHAAITQATAAAIDKRNWLAARNVFPSLEYGPPGTNSQVAPSQASTGPGEAPPRY